MLVDRDKLLGGERLDSGIPSLEVGVELWTESSSQFLAGLGLPTHIGTTEFTEGTVNWQNRVQGFGTDDYIAGLLGTPVELTSDALVARLKVHAAVLSVDMVDSTAFLAELERRGQSTGMALHRIFAPLAAAIKQRGGHFAKVIGDGLVAVFTESPAAWNALDSALELQENWQRDTDSGLFTPGLRVGLAYGVVEIQGLGPDREAHVIGSAVHRAFHCASGKSPAEKLPDLEPGFSVYLDRSLREQIGLPGLITTRP